MLRWSVLIGIAFAGAPVASSDRATVTPIQKVIEMMDSMLAKGEAEKHDEQVEFAKYHEWCNQVRDDKTRSIADATSRIEELDADIAKATADAETLSEELAQLEAKINKLTADVDAATSVRKSENTDYKAEHQDLSESIDALARAIQVLKSRKEDVPQSLLQVSKLARVPAREKALITSFLSFHSEVSAPEANAYEFQSGGILQLLGSLKLKFEDQRLALEKEEMNSKANFQTLMQRFTDDIKYDKATSAKKTALKAKRLEDASIAKGDKQATEASKAKDEKTLADTIAECKQTSHQYEKNQVIRSNEIKALTEAIEIISSGDVSGMGEKHLPSSLLQHKSPALSQLRSALGRDDVLKERAVKFLQDRSRELNSNYLALVATRASEDPFVKVKKMIKDLIVKLMEQANAEADHHEYCTEELATNKETRDAKSAEVEELTAELESQNALVEKLTTEAKELSDEVAKIKSEQKEATKMRMDEKKTNAATIADAKVAQDAVQSAIQILKKYYSSVAAGSALLQKALKSDMQQPASIEAYEGQQSSKGGILGMLDVILSDFTRLELQTAEAESTAAAAYEKFMEESDETVAVKEKEIRHKGHQKDTAGYAIRRATKTLALTQTELDAALEYYDKLKAECIDTGLSYAERVKMRREEIQSLQEALKVLSGEV